MYNTSKCLITQKNERKKENHSPHFNSITVNGLKYSLTQAYHDSQKILRFAAGKAYIAQQAPGVVSLGFLVQSLKVFFLVRNTLLGYENHSKLCISLMLLAGIHHHRFYKRNFRQRFEVKTPGYIGVLLVSNEICRNSICSKSCLKLIFRSHRI